MFGDRFSPLTSCSRGLPETEPGRLDQAFSWPLFERWDTSLGSDIIIGYLVCVRKKHRKTLEVIFKRPTQSGVNWADIESLFAACGAYIEEREGSRVYVELNDVAGHFHRPHPEEGSPKRSRRVSEEISKGGSDRTMMEHKGYRAVVTFDDAADVFHGEVMDTRDVICFRGHLRRPTQEGIRILG